MVISGESALKTAPADAATLDQVVDRREQEAWLASPLSDLDGTGRRPDDPEQRRRMLPNFDRLRQEPCFDELVQALRCYVAWTIPFPRRTERDYWLLGASPSTNRSNFPQWCVVSVRAVQTLVVARPVMHEERLAVRLLVDLEAAMSAWGSLDLMASSLPDLLIEDANCAARAGVLAIEADQVSALPSLLRLPGVAAAARQLNLSLMREGPVPYGRGHCFALADAVLEPGSAPNG